MAPFYQNFDQMVVLQMRKYLLGAKIDQIAKQIKQI